MDFTAIKPHFRGNRGHFCRYENRGRINTRTEGIFTQRETRMAGNRNILFLIIGALIVGMGVLSYNLYQAKKAPSGVQINVGPDGLKIQNK